MLNHIEYNQFNSFNSFKSVLGSDCFSHDYPSSDLIISCSIELYDREERRMMLNDLDVSIDCLSYDDTLTPEQARQKRVELELDYLQSQSVSLY